MNKFIHLSLSNNLEDRKEIEHFVSRWNMLEQILYLFGFYVLATLHSIIPLLLILQQSITLGLHMHTTPALTNTHQIIPPHLWSKGVWHKSQPQVVWGHIIHTQILSPTKTKSEPYPFYYSATIVWILYLL